MIKKSILWILLALCLLFTGCQAKAPASGTQKTLTLAVFYSDFGGGSPSGSNLSQWVNRYNEQHTDVKIDVVNYLDKYTDIYDALAQIKIEISAGKGPDMINFGRQYSPLDASSGMMADLYPFMQNDEAFDREDLYLNVLESFGVGNNLYVLVPGFAIESYATTAGELTGLEGMNIRQLINAYNMLDEESILFPGETKKAVFGMLCYGSLENYIDWGEGTCSFDSDSFKELLDFANRFPLNLNWAEDYSAKEVYTEGHALLYPVYIDTVYELTKTRLLFGETPTYIGYPFDSGGGNMAEITDLAIGISSTSPNKEEAWAFIKSLLDSEFQNNVKNGLPLRVSSLEQKLEDARKAEYDANGEKVVKEVSLFAGEAPDYIYEISAEDAGTLKSIISKIEHNATVDYNLYNILLEEVDYLFNDDRDVNDVARIIQNRASLYISESK